MTITFGLHLDGQRAFAPANRLGDTAVGPLGFLNLLETQLGLLAERPAQAERIVQYRDCLARADAPSRFYHASFEIDALGTASTLLGWRDLWHLHGWAGTMPQGTSARLADLEAVERLARGAVAPSVGERLQFVLSELDKRRVPIDRVDMVDPLHALPQRWQAVLARLPVQERAAPQGEGNGFLGRLQSNLRKAMADQPFEKLPWDDDGTVAVARAETRFLGASWLAGELDKAKPTLLVSGADGTRLDAQLASAGHPRQGFRETSAFRPTLQVLSLALEILWEPLNFYGLLQFLTHPVCPLPIYARRKLAAKVADAPGIGGERWDEVLVDIDEHYGAEAPAVRQQIRQWLEHTRYRHDEGAPIAPVIERTRCVAEFFRRRLGDDDDARRIAFNAGYAQCRACGESLAALQAQGVDYIRPRQLQMLVEQATANGTDSPLLVAEVGAQRAVTHPGAAAEPIEYVIWWQLGMPVLPAAYPWSSAELCSLAQAGVTLPGSDERFAQAAREWLRPILAARERLTLVLPPVGEEVHPVWQMIEAVVDRPRVQALERILSDGSATTEPVARRTLPAPKRWWHLPSDVPVALRANESFSSLELLLFNPYHWLLKYPAALRPSRLVTLGSDFRMLGNLAHGLVERYCRQPDVLTMNDAEFNAWFAPAFERLIDEEGALLRMAGRGADLESFRHRLQQAIQTLRQHFAAAGVTRIDPEKHLAGQFAGGALSGYADLVLHKSNAQDAIIDMKWSGAKKFPDKLKKNRHLQLAIYAELLRQETGAWPSVAYYVLDRAGLFAPDDRTSPDAMIVAPDSGENTAHLWQRFVETWKWRKAQVEAGAFEVALERIEPTDGSGVPNTAMDMEYLNESYNDYRALAGWSE